MHTSATSIRMILTRWWPAIFVDRARSSANWSGGGAPSAGNVAMKVLSLELDAPVTKAPCSMASVPKTDTQFLLLLSQQE